MGNEGNIYLTTSVVAVYNKDGEKIETIKVPEQPTNLCFGGKDKKTLFITAHAAPSLEAEQRNIAPDWASQNQALGPSPASPPPAGIGTSCQEAPLGGDGVVSVAGACALAVPERTSAATTRQPSVRVSGTLISCPP